MISNLLLQNIIVIPVMLAMCVSCFKMYKSIVKDKRRENVKTEIMRHTIFCLVMFILLILSSTIEVLISDNITKMIIKYF